MASGQHGLACCARPTNPKPLNEGVPSAQSGETALRQGSVDGGRGLTVLPDAVRTTAPHATLTMPTCTAQGRKELEANPDLKLQAELKHGLADASVSQRAETVHSPGSEMSLPATPARSPVTVDKEPPADLSLLSHHLGLIPDLHVRRVDRR